MATSDPKHQFKDSNILAPALEYAAVTKSDATDFSFGMARGLYVGGAGDVVAVRADNTAVTFTSVPAGTILPIRLRRVNDTSTTATNMVALY